MLAKFDGTKLHEVREQQDMSQAELAARAGTTIRYVRALKKEKEQSLRTTTLQIGDCTRCPNGNIHTDPAGRTRQFLL